MRYDGVGLEMEDGGMGGAAVSHLQCMCVIFNYNALKNTW